jgi:hypothetical protein
MIANNPNIRMIIFEEMHKAISFETDLSITQQVEFIVSKTDVTHISIGGLMIEAKELISKLDKIEIALLKHGENMATRLWYELGLPNLKNYEE